MASGSSTAATIGEPMQTTMRNGIAAAGAGTSAAAVRRTADTTTVAAAKAQAAMDRRKVESVRMGMMRVDRQLKVEVVPRICALEAASCGHATRRARGQPNGTR